LVRFNAETNERSLDALRWGLVPHWAKDLSFGYKCVNARAETVETSPAFRDVFKSRRCIIPASGFYEWKKTAQGEVPYVIVPADGLPRSYARDFAAGGVVDVVEGGGGKRDGAKISTAIVPRGAHARVSSQRARE